MTKVFDADKDGKVTLNDLTIYAKKVIKILAYRVPSAAGFAAAFYSGFNSKIWIMIILTMFL